MIADVKVLKRPCPRAPALVAVVEAVHQLQPGDIQAHRGYLQDRPFRRLRRRQHLCTRSRPSASSATKSVKVPPVSTRSLIMQAIVRSNPQTALQGSFR